MSEIPADFRKLFDRLSDPTERDGALAEIEALGPAALSAMRDGLRDGRSEVRRWCAYWFDRHADAASLHLLIPLLHDPKSKVRLFTVHSISCEHCKTGEKTIDVVPHLIERIEDDDSIRVRRMAAASLAYGTPDPRAVPVFRGILETESDRKLRLHATLGLHRCREAGLI